MKYKRQFIIVAYFNNGIKFEVESYIKKIIKNGLGYYYIRTVNPKKAKIWKVRKRCETAIDKINNLLDPTKYFLKKYKLKIVEITDNQTLREIKLKKINKNKK